MKNEMKQGQYKFVFKRTSYNGETTYTYVMDSYGRTATEVFERSTALLDFGLFDEVSMFDWTGRECTECY